MTEAVKPGFLLAGALMCARANIERMSTGIRVNAVSPGPNHIDSHVPGKLDVTSRALRAVAGAR
jgi:NAD(P)-dependent dehydrogenase (short-subunit alcohol dehydrogenase family)